MMLLFRSAIVAYLRSTRLKEDVEEKEVCDDCRLNMRRLICQYVWDVIE